MHIICRVSALCTEFIILRVPSISRKENCLIFISMMQFASYTQNLLEKTEMRMLRWMMGIKRN